MVLQRGKVSRPVLVILITFGVVILLPVLVFFIGFGPVDIAPASRDLDSAVAAYRAQGLPWEAKDLAPGPPLPNNQNAGPLIMEADATFEGNIWQKDKETISKDLIAANYGSAEATLRPYDKTLDKIEQATKLQGADFNHDWDLGPNVTFKEAMIMKAAAQCFADKAVIAASKSDAAGATRNLECALKLADFSGKVPTLIGMLVQIAIHNIAYHDYTVCAANFAGNEGALTALDKSLSSYQGKADFALAIRGEIYMGIAIMRNLDKYGGVLGLKRMMGGNSDDSPPLPPINPATLQRTGMPTGMWSRAFLDRHLRYWTACYKEIQANKDNPIAYSNAMENEANQFTKTRKLSGMLDEILLPVFSQAGIAVVREEAAQETSEALIKALEIRARTGKLPTSISQIPGHWIDPFDKKPLRLAMVGNSLRIYSVGQSLRDMGGLDPSEMKSRNDQDFEARNIIAAYPPIGPKM